MQRRTCMVCSGSHGSSQRVCSMSGTAVGKFYRFGYSRLIFVFVSWRRLQLSHNCCRGHWSPTISLLRLFIPKQTRYELWAAASKPAEGEQSPLPKPTPTTVPQHEPIGGRVIAPLSCHDTYGWSFDCSMAPLAIPHSLQRDCPIQVQSPPRDHLHSAEQWSSSWANATHSNPNSSTSSPPPHPHPPRHP